MVQFLAEGRSTQEVSLGQRLPMSRLSVGG